MHEQGTKRDRAITREHAPAFRCAALVFIAALAACAGAGGSPDAVRQRAARPADHAATFAQRVGATGAARTTLVWNRACVNDPIEAVIAPALDIALSRSPSACRSARGSEAAMALRSATLGTDLTKTIVAQLHLPVNAVTTWYILSCTQSGGVGTYVVNKAPAYGTLSFDTIDVPAPGCPPGSPPLPASQALYEMTTQKPDFFELYYELNGQVAEVDDITTALPTPQPTPSAPESPTACEAFFGQDFDHKTGAYQPNAFQHTPITACNAISTTSFATAPPFPLISQEKNGYCGQASAYMAMLLEAPTSPLVLANLVKRDGNALDVIHMQRLLAYFGFQSDHDTFGFSWSGFKAQIDANTPVVELDQTPNRAHWTTAVGWAETAAGGELVKVYDPGFVPTGQTRTISFGHYGSIYGAYVFNIAPG